MPVYNSSRFLKEAIESMLNQTYVNFELLLINDASTDNSEDIIKSFSDKRIIYIHQEKNLGPIVTLNKWIDSCRGKYIARMDADDISLADRIKKQVEFLEKNPNISALGAFVNFIDENGKKTGDWDIDRNNTSTEQIKNYLAKSNCLAHPTMMIKADVLRKYKYNVKQVGADDWDLWMRLIADRHIIAKLPEVLLKYRIHSNSIMAGEKLKAPVEKKLIRIKTTFLAGQLKKLKLNSFFFAVLASTIRSEARHIKLGLERTK